MSNAKSNGDLYRVVKKEGTHLAESKDTPGAVRGTLLSNSNRQLAGQAEFVKVDESELEYSPAYDYNYQETHAEVELTEEQKEMAAAFGIAIAEVTIWALSEVIAPRVKAWWQEKAAPSLKRIWQGLSDKKTPQKGKVKPQLRATQILEAKMAVPNLFTQELDDAYEKYSNDMTSEEAQKELLDIFILSAIVAAKMRKLSNAHIKDIGDVSGSYIEGKVVVERLFTTQFVNSINSILERNPRLLEESAVPLAGIIGRSLIVNGAFVPIERDAFREALTLR